MPSRHTHDLEVQAAILVHYFFKTLPDAAMIHLYSKAVSNGLPDHLDTKDLKLLDFGFTHPKFLPMLDAGLAVLRPSSELLRRIYMMFAILESMPQYSDKFLAKQRNPLYVFRITAIGTRAILRAIGGVLLVKVLQA